MRENLSFRQIERLLALRKRGLTPAQIAERLGVPHETVLHYSPRSKPVRRYIQRMRVLRLHARGLPHEDIARITGSHIATVRRWIATNDVGKPRPDYAEPGRVYRIEEQEEMMKKGKSVLVEFDCPATGRRDTALVVPSGRFEWCASASDPERQWHFEALDMRDGVTKMFALADVRAWIPPATGAAAIPLKNYRKVDAAA